MGHDVSPEDYARQIRQTVSGYRLAQIYITFAELELGAALQDGPLSLEELANRVGADQRSLERFIEAAIAFGIVRRTDGEQLELTEPARQVLAPSGSHSISNLLKLDAAFYERWGRLAQAVRMGKRPPENRAQEDQPGWVRRFTLALFDNARQVAPAVAEAIATALPDPGDRPLRLIDIGGGHGAYSLSIAEKRPDINATVFDLPPVIEVTRDIVAKSNVRNRVETVAGDFHEDPLGENYDVALLFGVLHGETPENAPRLVRAIHRALRPGGLLLIRSHGRAQGTHEPGERELFDLHMLLSTEGGVVQRAMDTTALVEANGFRSEPAIDIPSPGSGSLLVFRRNP
jgi:SAM-dependent methyltransferase